MGQKPKLKEYMPKPEGYKPRLPRDFAGLTYELYKTDPFVLYQINGLIYGVIDRYYSYAHHLVEDMFQEAFTRISIVLQGEYYTEQVYPKPAHSFLYTCVRNTVGNFLAKERRRDGGDKMVYTAKSEQANGTVVTYDIIDNVADIDAEGGTNGATDEVESRDTVDRIRRAVLSVVGAGYKQSLEKVFELLAEGKIPEIERNKEYKKLYILVLREGSKHAKD